MGAELSALLIDRLSWGSTCDDDLLLVGVITLSKIEESGQIKYYELYIAVASFQRFKLVCV